MPIYVARIADGFQQSKDRTLHKPSDPQWSSYGEFGIYFDYRSSIAISYSNERYIIAKMFQVSWKKSTY